MTGKASSSAGGCSGGTCTSNPIQTVAKRDFGGQSVLNGAGAHEYAELGLPEAAEAKDAQEISEAWWSMTVQTEAACSMGEPAQLMTRPPGRPSGWVSCCAGATPGLWSRTLRAQVRACRQLKTSVATVFMSSHVDACVPPHASFLRAHMTRRAWAISGSPPCLAGRAHRAHQ
eukprot:CAMPEP_0170229324 /NCGR_PEP_ID=MMETSP0116_2-20130129/14386_1 /TAXON_ID=400756 /ORGANISM="Durinskia baltica, Strain CSIRO CS-38" /LENGTH=172 /DNA_ID=CAMNT_0010480075 /DNA_START=171 /DNA_END=687 /DNA_ORIENTATION=-